MATPDPRRVSATPVDTSPPRLQDGEPFMVNGVVENQNRASVTAHVTVTYAGMNYTVDVDVGGESTEGFLVRVPSAKAGRTRVCASVSSIN